MDKLDFNELVNMADSSSRLNELIRQHHMIAKYRIDQVPINLYDCFESRIDENYILVCNFETILRFLRLFGDLLTKLVFTTGEDDFNSNQINVMNQHIVQYCSKTLTELSLIRPKSYLLGETPEPSEYSILRYFRKKNTRRFDRVTELLIRHYSESVNLELDRIYPMLDTLYFISAIDLNQVKSLARPYPHLQHLVLFTPTPLISAPAVQRLFKQNPQLTSLTFDKCPDMELLKLISHEVRSLQALQLPDCFSDDVNSNFMQQIHFPNVTEFVVLINSTNENVEIPFMFDQLEILEVNAEYFTGPVQNFIRRNKKLKTLVVTAIYKGEDLERAIAAIKQLPVLESLFIGWVKTFNLDSTLREVEENENLKTIALLHVKVDDILPTLPSNWKLINNEHSSEYTQVIARQ